VQHVRAGRLRGPRSGLRSPLAPELPTIAEVRIRATVLAAPAGIPAGGCAPGTRGTARWRHPVIHERFRAQDILLDWAGSVDTKAIEADGAVLGQGRQGRRHASSCNEQAMAGWVNRYRLVLKIAPRRNARKATVGPQNVARHNGPIPITPLLEARKIGVTFNRELPTGRTEVLLIKGRGSLRRSNISSFNSALLASTAVELAHAFCGTPPNRRNP
jgi:hypothetical protein